MIKSRASGIEALDSNPERYREVFMITTVNEWAKPMLIAGTLAIFTYMGLF